MNAIEQFLKDNDGELEVEQRGRLAVVRFWLGLVFGFIGLAAWLVLGVSVQLLVVAVAGGYVAQLAGWILYPLAAYAVARGSRPLRMKVYRSIVARAQRQLDERRTRRLAATGGTETPVVVK